MDHRKQWARLENATPRERARIVAGMKQPAIIRLLRWSDRDGEYPSAWSHEDAAAALLISLGGSESREHAVRSLAPHFVR